MESLIMIVDLGRVRCVRIRPGGDDPTELIHLEEVPCELEPAPPTDRSEVATDQPGSFQRGGPAGIEHALSHGEEHNLETELERRTLEEIAARIAEVLKEHGDPSWILAAPQPILPRLEKALPEACRLTLAETVEGDLTRIPLAELEERFLADA